MRHWQHRLVVCIHARCVVRSLHFASNPRTITERTFWQHRIFLAFLSLAYHSFPPAALTPLLLTRGRGTPGSDPQVLKQRRRYAVLEKVVYRRVLFTFLSLPLVVRVPNMPMRLLRLSASRTTVCVKIARAQAFVNDPFMKEYEF